MFLLLMIIVLFLWLESAVTSLPLFLLAVLVMLIFYPIKYNLVFVLAFLGGLILDASAVRFLGSSSIFLTCWLFFILLYERKYEIDTIPFVLVASFFGIFSYLWLFGYGDKLIQAGVGSIIAVLLFIILNARSAEYRHKFQRDCFAISAGSQ